MNAQQLGAELERLQSPCGNQGAHMPLRALPAPRKVGGAHNLDGVRETHGRVVVDGEARSGDIWCL
jgi:hypothetical protein